MTINRNPHSHLHVSRVVHTASLLENGYVLVFGGQNVDGTMNSVKLYGPNNTTMHGRFCLTIYSIKKIRTLHHSVYEHTQTNNYTIDAQFFFLLK